MCLVNLLPSVWKWDYSIWNSVGLGWPKVPKPETINGQLENNWGLTCFTFSLLAWACPPEYFLLSLKENTPGCCVCGYKDVSNLWIFLTPLNYTGRGHGGWWEPELLFTPCLLLKWSDRSSKIRVWSKTMSTVKGNFSMIVSFHKWLNTDLWVIACNFSLFSACLLTLSRPRLPLPVSYAGIRDQKAYFVMDLERHSPHDP